MQPADYFSLERREMLPFVPLRRQRVLEIGCGEGRFCAALTGVAERWGIEPSAAAELAKPRLDRILRATFDEAEQQLPPGFFDLVICNDVIEHMPDHSSFLLRIRKYIAPGGVMIGSIPNVRFYKNLFQYLLEKDWYYTDNGILDRTHLRFFTKKSLLRDFEQHGYEVLKLSGINAAWPLSKPLRNLIYLSMAYAMIAASLGYFRDIRYLQFAFQVRPKP